MRRLVHDEEDQCSAVQRPTQAASRMSQGRKSLVTGVLRPEAGLGNRALVAEGYATMLSPGTYRLAAQS
jgi:hypothetical protein